MNSLISRNAECWRQGVANPISHINWHYRFAKFPEILKILEEINQLAICSDIQLTGLNTIYAGKIFDNSVACGEVRTVNQRKANEFERSETSGVRAERVARTVVNPYCALWLNSLQLLNFFRRIDDFMLTEDMRFFVGIRILDRDLMQNILSIPYFCEDMTELQKEAIFMNSDQPTLVLPETLGYFRSELIGDENIIRRMVTYIWSNEFEFPTENNSTEEIYPLILDFETVRGLVNNTDLGIGYYQLILCEDLRSDGSETRSGSQINQEFFSQILRILQESESN